MKKLCLVILTNRVLIIRGKKKSKINLTPGMGWEKRFPATLREFLFFKGKDVSKSCKTTLRNSY